MAEDRLTIDDRTLLDNVDDRQVEFSAELDGQVSDFAVRYSALEALSTERPETEDALALFRAFRGRIEQAGTKAVAFSPEQGRIVIGEGDLV